LGYHASFVRQSLKEEKSAKQCGYDFLVNNGQSGKENGNTQSHPSHCVPVGK
jgi:hypothetical protein